MKRKTKYLIIASAVIMLLIIGGVHYLEIDLFEGADDGTKNYKIVNNDDMPIYYCNGTIADVFLEDFYYGHLTEQTHKHTVVLLENATIQEEIEIKAETYVLNHSIDQLIFDSSDYGKLHSYIGKNVQLKYMDQTVILYYELISVKEVET